MPPDVDIPFGAWMKRRRARHDLTQERLTAQVGCAPQTLRTFETGVRRTSRTLAEIIEQAASNVF